MVKSPSPSKLQKRKRHPLIKYNRETGETEVSTYETYELEETTPGIKQHKFILSFTVHIGLQEDNDWLGFNNAADAYIKREELINAGNVSNINLSAVEGKING